MAFTGALAFTVANNQVSFLGLHHLGTLACEANPKNLE
jgi:hypothetical protein